MSRYDWMDNALCAQTDPDLFHVDGSGNSYGTAKKVCASCPVTRECGDFAQTLEAGSAHNWRFGLWGGEAPHARADRRNKRARSSTHEEILRLVDRGGMDANEIAEQVGVDPRTVFRVTKRRREEMGEAA